MQSGGWTSWTVDRSWTLFLVNFVDMELASPTSNPGYTTAWRVNMLISIFCHRHHNLYKSEHVPLLAIFQQDMQQADNVNITY